MAIKGLTILLAFALCLSAPDPLSAKTGKPAPSFRATNLEGKETAFAPDRLQKPTLLVFWATWCDKCVYEMPELAKLFEEQQSKIGVLGVNLDQAPEKAADLVHRARIPYANVSDKDGAIANLYRVNATPTMILVDEKGIIRYEGHYSADVLKHLPEPGK